MIFLFIVIIVFHLIKEKEEKSSRPFPAHAIDTAYVAVIGVLDTAVAAHVANAAVVAVLDAAVAADVANAAVVRVLDTTITADVANATVVGVLDAAIAADVANAAVVGILDAAIAAHIACRRIVAVVDRLCICWKQSTSCKAHNHGYDKSHNLHKNFYLEVLKKSKKK